jgi:hypothetical protein
MGQPEKKVWSIKCPLAPISLLAGIPRRSPDELFCLPECFIVGILFRGMLAEKGGGAFQHTALTPE